MKVSASCAILALCIAAASAQIVIPGQCQDVTVEQEFDLQQYTGRWYEYKRYFTFYQLNGKCVSATYTDQLNNTIEVRNYLIDSTTSEVEIILGYARPNPDYPGEGKLFVAFPSVGGAEGDYWVLGTDYVNYTVIWSCVNSGGQSLQMSWLLTRERVPSAETLAAAQAVIDANGLADNFLITDQTDCPPDEF